MSLFLFRRRVLILRRLRKCGAFSPETAKSLAQAGILTPNMFPSFTNHLVETNVLGRTDDGKYYVK